MRAPQNETGTQAYVANQGSLSGSVAFAVLYGLAIAFGRETKPSAPKPGGFVAPPRANGAIGQLQPLGLQIIELDSKAKALASTAPFVKPPEKSQDRDKFAT
jgi:hypothetical protein